jgi:hypothetical protein
VLGNIATLYNRWHLSMQHLKQHSGAMISVKPVNAPDHVSHRTIQDPDLIAVTEILDRSKEAQFVCHFLEILNDTTWGSQGSFTVHNKSAHAECSVHRAPSVDVQIQGNKQIAREEGDYPIHRFAGMANGS